MITTFVVVFLDLWFIRTAGMSARAYLCRENLRLENWCSIIICEFLEIFSYWHVLCGQFRGSPAAAAAAEPQINGLVWQPQNWYRITDSAPVNVLAEYISKSTTMQFSAATKQEKFFMELFDLVSRNLSNARRNVPSSQFRPKLGYYFFTALLRVLFHLVTAWKLSQSHLCVTESKPRKMVLVTLDLGWFPCFLDYESNFCSVFRCRLNEPLNISWHEKTDN